MLTMSTHLVRISEIFAPWLGEILDLIAAQKVKKLGSEYYLFQTHAPEGIRNSSVSRFIRFHLPIEHSWPCNPENMDGFIEKAAQSLHRKFGDRKLQTLLVGQLDPGDPKRYYKLLASNFRGRALQVFEFPDGTCKSAEDQKPDDETLFCWLGKEGLYAGVSTPRDAGGFYPGGTKFIAQNADDTVSRAGAKIAEGLHFISMYRKLPPAGAHWLELGASPGGMTSELLKRGYRVSAVDRAPLDKRLAGHSHLGFFREDVSGFVPPRGIRYDAILSDMNGQPLQAATWVMRLKDFLRVGALAVFTLKTTGVETIGEIESLENDVIQIAASNGFKLIAIKHLTYNRHEFTLFFERV